MEQETLTSMEQGAQVVPEASGASTKNHHFVQLRRPPRCAPTLYAEGSDPPEFDHLCMIALNALDDPKWDGRWRLTDGNVMELLNDIEGDDDKQDDGLLQIDEIVSFAAKEKNREHVLATFPSSIHGILNESLVKEAYSVFDADRSGSLDKEEWQKFVRVLEILHTQYLLRKSLVSFRAFFGRGHVTQYAGAPATEEEEKSTEPLRRTHSMLSRFSTKSPSESPEVRTFQIGFEKDLLGSSWNPVPLGWWADLYYYSANNHPIHGILACDPNHPLSREERVGMELSTIGFSFFSAELQASWVEDHHAPLKFLEVPLVFSLIIVTLPGIVIWQVLFFFFTCPNCGFVNNAHAAGDEVQKAKRWSCVAAVIAWCLLSLGIIGGIIHLVLSIIKHHEDTGRVSKHLELVFFGRLRGYVIAWLTMLLISFNPLVAWGQPNPAGTPSLGDYIGVGQWRIEKQRFHWFCSKHRESIYQQSD